MEEEEKHDRSDDCSGNSDNEESWTKLLLENIAIPTLCIVGFAGNFVTIRILRRPSMKSTFNHSLIVLATIDILFLAITFCNFSFDFSYQVYVLLFPYFLHPMQSILMNCQTYLIMGIAFERLLAVLQPLRYRGSDLRQSFKLHALIFILPCLVFSVVINLPVFFESKLVWNKGQWKVQPTSLRLDPNYIYYYIHWTRLILTGVAPFLILMLCNFFIYKKVIRRG